MTSNTLTEQYVQEQAVPKKIWLTAFVFSFLALLCDGADVGFLAISLNSIKHDFGLTSLQAGSLGSWSLLGLAIGGLSGGWACDQFGRVRVIVLGITSFSILTFWIGFTETYLEFAIARTLSCVGLGSIYIACNTLMSEYVPTKYRSTALAALMTGYTMGSMVSTMLAGWIVPIWGWRMLYWISISPLVLAVLTYFLVPEPASWKKSKELQRQGVVTQAKDSPYRAMLSNAKTKRMFIFWTLSCVCLSFGYYGISSWMPAYLESELGIKFKDMIMYMVGSYMTMILGKVVSGYIADRIGRRIVYAFGTIGTAIFVPFLIHYHNADNIVWMMLIFGFLYGIPYALCATYMTESFPTAIRGTAVGAAYNIGRGAAIFAPITIGLLAQGNSIGLGILIMAGAYFLSGLIPALFIKERQYDPQKA